MTVGEYLAFVAGLRAVDPGRIQARVTETEERTGLAALDDERISTLSHGYRQRVGVAQALVHAPDVLLLDEPANGLDPVQNVEMRGAHPEPAWRPHGAGLQPHPSGDRPDL